MSKRECINYNKDSKTCVECIPKDSEYRGYNHCKNYESPAYIVKRMNQLVSDNKKLTAKVNDNCKQISILNDRLYNALRSADDE